jgi:hypothetical protein
MTMKHQIPCHFAILVAATIYASGCAFIESATEQTIGAGMIERVSQEIEWPSVDAMTGLDSADTSAIPGFPTSLAQGTFAHLQGVLNISGECSHTEEVDTFGDSEQLEAIDVTVTSCTSGTRCAELCPEGFRGMTFEAAVKLKLLTAEVAAEMKDQLEQLTPESIVQIRFQVHALQLFQNDANGERTAIHPWIEGFELLMGNDDGDEVSIIKQKELETITPETPQRFDVGSASTFTTKLKASILAGQETSAWVIVRMQVPQYNLYEVMFDGAGVDMDIQPEFVISVIEVVKDML